MSRGSGVPAEALPDLRRRLDELSLRHRGRPAPVEGTAELYGVSRATVYRALAGQLRPRGLRRADRGEPRKVPRAELERYCGLVAALKLRTSNLYGLRLSSARCTSLLGEYGVEMDGWMTGPDVDLEVFHDPNPPSTPTRATTREDRPGRGRRRPRLTAMDTDLYLEHADQFPALERVRTRIDPVAAHLRRTLAAGDVDCRQ